MKAKAIAMLGLLGALVANVQARADAIEDFYKGRQIKAIVGNPAGTDYDNWMRLLTRHWGRFIPGKPTFVVINMPGAGQIIAANHVATIADKDGSVVAFTERALPYLLLTGEKNIRFDPRDLNFIGSPEQTNRTCVVNKSSPVQSAEELFQKELLIGGAGAGTSVTNTPILLRNLLGMKFKLIEGYGSADAVILAMERGEVNAICQTVGGILRGHPDAFKTGKFKPLFTMEHDPVPGLNAPTIYQYTKTKEQADVISFYDSSLELGRPVVTTPGVPAERVKALRDSFAAMMVDREFLAESDKLGFEITPRSGEKLQEIVKELMATKPEIITRAAEMMR
jgi:tripartite-type tricarboxylate transporter receptor subunit TctC